MGVWRYSVCAWARMCVAFDLDPEDAAVLSRANDACFCARYPGRSQSEPATAEQIRAAIDAFPALAVVEGMPSDANAARIFGASQVPGERTADEWMELYLTAREAEATMAEAAECSEE